MESVKIAGAGTIQGGEYDEVKISGSGRIVGDVTCNEFKGAGSITIEKSLTAKEFKCSGAVKIEGKLKVKEGKISGAGKILGDVEAEELEIHGSLVVEGDINAEEFIGKLGSGSFNNIYGETIMINTKGEFIGGYFHDVITNVRINEIEATTICLKDVKAKRVSGENVVIESGCTIDVVEYSNKLDISSKAEVKKIIKL